MNKKANLLKAVLAGISGTIGMTAFMMMGNLMGLKMNVPQMLASVMGGNISTGWALHFMIGTSLAIIYEYIFLTKIHISNPLVRGAVYGIIPWLMAQTLVMPMMAQFNGMSFTDGLFSGSIFLSGASLMAHFVFGAIVGIITKDDKVLIPTANNA